MSIKSVLAIPFAKIVRKQVYKWANNPHKTQEKVFQYLVAEGCKTAFGKDHDFVSINNYEDFKKDIVTPFNCIFYSSIFWSRKKRRRPYFH